jgi:hypothetical protein
VEEKLAEHMDSQALGEPLETNKTVKATLGEILANQGGFIQGDGKDAFEAVVETIVTMLREENHDSGGAFDPLESTPKNFHKLAERNHSLERANDLLKSESMAMREEILSLKHELELVRQKLRSSGII